MAQTHTCGIEYHTRGVGRTEHKGRGLVEEWGGGAIKRKRNQEEERAFRTGRGEDGNYKAVLKDADSEGAEHEEMRERKIP
jgi:hypothetical protein